MLANAETETDSHGHAAVSRGEFFDAPVVEVTLLEDRAHVVRRGRGSFPAGVHTISVPAVAPVLGDKTLTARVTGRAKVLDVRVKRANITRSEDRPTTVREIEKELEEIQFQIDAATERRMLLDGQIAALHRVAEQTLAEIAVDAGWGRASSSAWHQELQLLAKEELELRKQTVERAMELDKLALEKKDLQRIKRQLDTLANLFSATIEAEFVVQEAGDCEIQFDYVVPGACWRPYHTARLMQQPEGRVTFLCEACVWQNTGEDWNDVKLLFSTQRPSLGTEPPLLADDVLSLQRKQPQLEVETREQEIYTTGLGGGESKPDSAQLPGIDDCGEVVNVRSDREASVPSDGRPYRVPVGSFESPAETENVCMPEREPSVFLKSLQTNQGPHPILAGPVDLIRDSGFVGRTSVKYIAPGEKFELGWGPDPDLRVHREHTQHDEKDKMLSSSVKIHHRVKVQLSNLGPREKAVTLTERIPVSEIAKVQITCDEKNTTAGRKPDEDGFMRWHIDMGAFGQRRIELRYVVKKHKSVVGI